MPCWLHGGKTPDVSLPESVGESGQELARPWQVPDVASLLPCRPVGPVLRMAPPSHARRCRKGLAANRRPLNTDPHTCYEAEDWFEG